MHSAWRHARDARHERPQGAFVLCWRWGVQATRESDELSRKRVELARAEVWCLIFSHDDLVRLATEAPGRLPGGLLRLRACLPRYI